MATTAPSTVFYVIDDTDVSGKGAGSGQPLSPDFVAPTLAAATQVGYLIATTLQRDVRLVNKFYQFPNSTTKISAGPANTALTVAPSGVGIA